MGYYQEKCRQIQSEIQKVIIGKEEVIEQILMAILAKGHVLLEDIPGVGKTTLALAFSKALSLSYKRMQFTPDVLPADVTGFSLYNRKTQEFEYKEGAVLCNLFLADEINRTSPKTQAALLEVMEEGKVTVDGVTRVLPNPFFVIATQNPLGSIGTQKLPESQLDRFMIKLSMGYPDPASEALMLKNEQQNMLEQVNTCLNTDEIINVQKEVGELYVSDEMYCYIADLVWASRSSAFIKNGISPRDAKALLRYARAKAYLQGRNYLVPEDVRKVYSLVGSHRITLSAQAKTKGQQETEILDEVANQVPMPGGIR